MLLCQEYVEFHIEFHNFKYRKLEQLRLRQLARKALQIHNANLYSIKFKF